MDQEIPHEAPHGTPEVLSPASVFTPQMLLLTSFVLAILGLIGIHPSFSLLQGGVFTSYSRFLLPQEKSTLTKK